MRRAFFLSLVIFLAGPGMSIAHGGVNDAELIIRMTRNGFEPKELTVVAGDKVTFINENDTKRWPASNFHPTHEIYPEFDPLRSILPGESWIHTFDQVGTWRMHDHLIPHMTGTIVVLEDPGTKNKESDKPQEIMEEKTSWGWLGKIKAFFLKLYGTN